jgi:putative tryptophan/tyrosine transport system substrate-binding protein
VMRVGAATMLPLGLEAGMKRRTFIAGLGSATAWFVGASAQQSGAPVIGLLSVNSPETTVSWIAAFRQGLNDVGYVDGQNVAIEYRWGRGNFDRMGMLATELVDRQVNVLVNASGSAWAAKRATTTMPIVSMFGGDPVESALVASLNKPGGNLRCPLRLLARGKAARTSA